MVTVQYNSKKARITVKKLETIFYPVVHFPALGGVQFLCN